MFNMDAPCTFHIRKVSPSVLGRLLCPSQYRLKEDNISVFYKDKLTPPPASRLQGDTFILCVQTPFQIDAFWHLGDGGFISIDATYNVTHFWDMLLFMIIARDR
jgi:hypothetical protein